MTLDVDLGDHRTADPGVHRLELADRVLDQIERGLLPAHHEHHGIGERGWAQVNGWRGRTDSEAKMAGRLSHDLHYIENWSLILDLKILALTLVTGFGRKNAH